MTYDKFKKDKNFTIELTDKIIDDFKSSDIKIDLYGVSFGLILLDSGCVKSLCPSCILSLT